MRYIPILSIQNVKDRRRDKQTGGHIAPPPDLTSLEKDAVSDFPQISLPTMYPATLPFITATCVI